jgi:hypothetical protein
MREEAMGEGASHPTADAVGYRLSPLLGWESLYAAIAARDVVRIAGDAFVLSRLTVRVFRTGIPAISGIPATTGESF